MNPEGLTARDSILDALDDAILVIDPEGRIIQANRSALELCGHHLDRLIGNPVNSVLSPLVPIESPRSGQDGLGWDRPVQAILRRVDGTGKAVECMPGARPVVENGMVLTVLTLRPLSEPPEDRSRDALLDYLRMTSRLTDRLGSRPSLQHVLATAVETLLEDFNASLARVWLLEERPERFRLAATGTPTQGVRIDSSTTLDGIELPPEVREVARSGMHFLVENLRIDQRFDQEWVDRHGLGSLIALPLNIARERHGILVAAMPTEPSDECLDALLGFASIISAALNDVQLLLGELSARVDAEAEHRRFQSIVDLIPIGVVLVTGPDPWVTLINPVIKELLGRSDLAPMPLQQFSRALPIRALDGAPVDDPDQPLWQAFSQHKEVRQTIRYRRPDGIDRIFEVIAGPFPAVEGGAIATYHDITERSELQSDLATRAAQLKALLDHLPVGVAYFDLDCRCRACNGPAWRILGRSRSEIIGASAEELFADSPGLQLAVRRCVDELEPHAQINAPWNETAGGESIRFLEWRFEPLLTSSREPIGALALIGDVTARKRTADAMQKAKDDAERSAQNKTRFLSAISHDLRTPVNALNLLAEALARRLEELPDDRELSRLSGYLQQASGNLAELVSDLLDLTCFDSGVVIQQPVDFSIAEWFESTLGPLELAARDKGLTCSWSIESEVTWIRTDRVKLGRIVTNLVGNAIKFTESGSIQVTVTISPDGRLEVEVEDTGPGIPDAQLVRIFDEFAQLRNPERDRSKGTGLGLAICRRLVEAAGGTLVVTSQSGQGSRFVAAVPVTPLPAPPGQRPWLLKDVADQNGIAERPRVLLVEDDETTRLPMCHLLELSGFNVVTASDGHEALEILVELRPTLILLDLMMPRMDGIEVLRRIRNDVELADLPVLILSGDVLEERERQLRALGVSGTLSKPIDFDQLLSVLEEMTAQTG